MDASEALKLIRPLAEGIDPETGEQFPEKSPYQNVNIVRALYSAIEALEKESARESRRKRLPTNAGKPWTQEEDDSLVQQFDAGRTISELSRIHQRTSGAIHSRLAKLGKIEAQESAT